MPTKNHRLCSAHFSADQLARDPQKLEEHGYADARIRLLADAFPDISFPLSMFTMKIEMTPSTKQNDEERIKKTESKC